MPGHNEGDAVRNFLEPLQRAIAVLDGPAKIAVTSKGKAYQRDQRYMWQLNKDDGLVLRGVGTLHAGMHFSVIHCDPEFYGAPLRVTTHGYQYKLVDPSGHDVWRMHWHPDGKSSVQEPHLHIRPNLKDHNVTPRMTFEKAITWCIAASAPLTCATEEALNELLITETNHLLYRSWHERPDEPHG